MKDLSGKYLRLSIAFGGIALIVNAIDMKNSELDLRIAIFLIGITFFVIGGILWYKANFISKK